jgi:S-adenosylmethionine:tRNA ribosyltransferase-isomerase
MDDVFANLGDRLSAGDLLVVNDTRVRAARLHGIRPTGGRVELLLLRDDGVGRWQALAKPARKLVEDMELSFGPISAVVRKVGPGGRVTVTLQTDGDLEELIAEQGSVPLPPYITNERIDPSRYQTVYAGEVGSAAAPTAGLHFTEGLLAALRAGGVEVASVSLDVGVDTFRPISTDLIDQHVMHSERYHVPEPTTAAVARTRARGGRVIAVGTTTVRCLEAAAGTGSLQPGPGVTDLFIRPGFVPRVIDGLVTNFHMPGSSLLVMISAFLPDWREAYMHALESGYRFLSFGDAMLIPEMPR